MWPKKKCPFSNSPHHPGAWRLAYCICLVLLMYGHRALDQWPPWPSALIPYPSWSHASPAMTATFPACTTKQAIFFLFQVAGGHHDGRPYCHKPCYAALFGPKGVNIGGAGSYVYDTPANNNPTSVDSAPKPEEKRVYAPKAASKAGSITTFSGEANLCPRCNKKVYFAEKVTSLGKDWHRPCLRCERCSKTLSAGSHAEHDGQPYCHKPCYAVLFGPKGVNTGGVGSYIYDKEPSAVTQP
ncbi:cysteine-rich protein 2-like protein [Lates japonicus]|uniref:Cysteine-rich protein 2 n=1 Tax=Lates japonicus TaxID=270547 RepID=A0AAD3QXD1_LATJO|nr:cysteine-rich protein 2-like protein [Lates japonicus]